MSTEMAERRKGRAFGLWLLAALSLAVAAVSIAIEGRASRPDTASGPVAPGLEARIADAQRIHVISSEASYQIERTQRGWAMRDRGDYPVLATRLAQLTEGLEGLTYVRRMTSDPAKHARLGVGDPRQGGRGVLVQVEDGQGAFLVNVILGIEPGGLYARTPDQDQAWAIRGELPPLRDIAAWLDLAPLVIEPTSLARVEVVPTEGRPYVLERGRAEDQFAIVAPARLEPMTAAMVTAAAEQITRLSPVDVQPAPAIQGPPRARVRAITFSGVVLDAEVIDRDGKSWVKIVARAPETDPTPEQTAAALEINNRSAGWAYGLSQVEADALVPPLAALLPPPPGPPPSAPPPL